MSDLALVFKHSVISYFKNVPFILFFSLPFLLALIVPFLSPLPTYIALGGVFLRTGSIPNLELFDVAVIALSVLASLFFISFASVSIAAIVKSQRTMTNIKTEIIEGIERFTLSLFYLYLFAWLVSLLAVWVGFSLGLSFLASLVSLVLYLMLFYTAPALVIDELKIGKAVIASVALLKKKPLFVVFWMLLAACSIALLEQAMLFVLPSTYAVYGALIFNALILMPFLCVLQIQMYMSKYTIVA